MQWQNDLMRDDGVRQKWTTTQDPAPSYEGRVVVHALDYSTGPSASKHQGWCVDGDVCPLDVQDEAEADAMAKFLLLRLEALRVEAKLWRDARRAERARHNNALMAEIARGLGYRDDGGAA